MLAVYRFTADIYPVKSCGSHAVRLTPEQKFVCYCRCSIVQQIECLLSKSAFCRNLLKSVVEDLEEISTVFDLLRKQQCL